MSQAQSSRRRTGLIDLELGSEAGTHSSATDGTHLTDISGTYLSAMSGILLAIYSPFLLWITGEAYSVKYRRKFAVR